MIRSTGALAAFILNNAYAAENADGFEGRRALAEETLHWLQGEWRFKLGERTGVRIVKEAYADHLIFWRETFDGIDVEGQGYTGYAPENDQFYSFSVHNIAGEFGMMLGKMNDQATEITYRSALDSSPSYEVVWRKLDDNRFSFSLYEALQEGDAQERWTAVFTRIE